GAFSVLHSVRARGAAALVSLSVDGTVAGTNGASPCNFSWSTAGVANGSHILTATASDAAGNTASTQITVTVSNSILDTTPPTVSISSPAAGATGLGARLVPGGASRYMGVSSRSLSVPRTLLRTL